MTRTSVLGVLLLLASGASPAGVELLPGSSPQRAAYLQEFGPIGVRVMDPGGKPLGGARVFFSLPDFVLLLEPVTNVGCTRDLGIHCEVRTNGEGIAHLQTLRGVWPGTHTVTVRASPPDDPGGALGSVTLVLTVDAPADSPSMEIVSGSDQRVVTGAPLDPLVVRVVDAAGRALPGVEIAFVSSGPTRVDFPGAVPSVARVVTGADGRAASPVSRAGAGIGAGQVTASFPHARYVVFTRFDFVVTNAQGSTELDLQDMWWSGFGENGWGVSIAQHGDRLFPVIYAYDAQGRATWYVVSGGAWRDRFATFTGSAATTTGSPYYAYDPARLRLLPAFPDMRLYFEGASASTLQLRAGQVLAEKRLSRQDFTSDVPAPLQGLGDMWWGGQSQFGWGIALMEQAGGLFSVWFTYDEDGRPTWFVMPAGAWTDARTFEGEIFRTSGPRWPDYDKSRLVIARVGSFSYRFHDRERATFRWTIGARWGSNEITRQPF